MDAKDSKPLITYAQNREDIILASFFPDIKEGFYVDVGANHPIGDSVTKMFYENGWRGINIEPIKTLHKKLTKDRPEDVNLALGVSSKRGKAKFTEFEVDGLSTFSDEMKKVSGKETDDALLGNDWKKYRPEVICIEANHVDHDWRPILTDNGYTLAFFDGLNEYYVEEKSIEREAYFRENYPKMLVKAPIIEMPWQKVIDRMSAQLNRVQESLDERASTATRLEEELNSAQAELSHVKKELEDIKHSRNPIKRVGRKLPKSVKDRLRRR